MRGSNLHLLPLLALAISACGAREPRVAPRALQMRRTLDRDKLAYQVAFVGEGELASVELGSDFELVLRDISNIERPRQIRRITLGSSDYDIHALAVDSRHRRAWIASHDGRVRAFDLDTGRVVLTWHLGASATALALDPSGRHVAMGTAEGVICLRRQSDGALLQCMVADQGRISGLDFSSDGERLSSASWTGSAAVWRVPTLALVARRRFDGVACDIAFAPDGRRVAVARSGFIPRLGPRQNRGKGRAETSPRRTPADRRHAVSLWTPESDAVTRLDGHAGPVTTVAWTPDSSRVLSGSWDRSVRLWQADSGKEIARYRGFSLLVHDLAVAPGGRLVAAAAWVRSLEGRSLVLLGLSAPP